MQVLVILYGVPETLEVFSLPPDAPELPALREAAEKGLIMNCAYKERFEKEAVEKIALLFWDNNGLRVGAPMAKYEIIPSSDRYRLALRVAYPLGYSEVLCLSFLM